MSPKELDSLIKSAVKIHKENSNFRFSALPGENILVAILKKYERLLSVQYFCADHSIDLRSDYHSAIQRIIYNAMEDDGELISPNPFMKTVNGKSLFEYNGFEVTDPAIVDELELAFITAIKAVFAAKHLMIDEGETNDEIIKLRELSEDKKRKELDRGPERRDPPIERSPSNPFSESYDDPEDSDQDSDDESSEGGNDATADKNRPSKNVMREIFDNFVRQNYDYKKGNDQKKKQLNYALVNLHFGDPPNYDAFWKALPTSNIYKRSANVRQILGTKLKCKVAVEVPAEVPETEPIKTTETVPPITTVPPPFDPKPEEKTANRYWKNIRASKSCFRIVLAEELPPTDPSPAPPDPSPAPPDDDPFGYKSIFTKLDDLPDEPMVPPKGPTSTIELQAINFYTAGMLDKEYVCNQSEIKNLMGNLMTAVDEEVRRNPFENIFGLDYLISGMNILNSLPPARQKGRLI